MDINPDDDKKFNHLFTDPPDSIKNLNSPESIIHAYFHTSLKSPNQKKLTKLIHQSFQNEQNKSIPFRLYNSSQVII